MIYLVKTVLIPVPRYVGCVGECQTSVGPVFGGFGQMLLDCSWVCLSLGVRIWIRRGIMFSLELCGSLILLGRSSLR